LLTCLPLDVFKRPLTGRGFSLSHLSLDEILDERKVSLSPSLICAMGTDIRDRRKVVFVRQSNYLSLGYFLRPHTRKLLS
jgi:hypothetical protein